MSDLEEIRVALSGEPSVVCAYWHADPPRLTVALDEAGTSADDYREAARRVSALVLPLLARARASLACGPIYGVMPTERGSAIYERDAS